MDTEVRRRRRVSRPAWGAALATVVVVLLPVIAHADSMRCGSRLIKEDDTLEKVLEVCGEPAKRERTWMQRAPQFERGGQEYSFPGREDVPVDLWTYDFGPNKLMQRVRMVAGKVESITTLGYGTK